MTVILVLGVVGAITEVYLPLLFRERVGEGPVSIMRCTLL